MSGNRRQGDDRRAVSTVVDVSLALLLISGSLLLVATHFLNQEQEINEEDSREVATMLSGSSAELRYTLEPITSDSEYPANGPGDFGSTDFTRNVHGSPVELVADAAVTNITIDGTQVSSAAENYSDVIGSVIRDRLTGAQVSSGQVVATWRPYQKGSVHGKAISGQLPPGNADVTITTINISSGMADISGEVAAGYETNGTYGAARPIARELVTGMFPPDTTQRAIESDGITRKLDVYRYKRLQTILSDRGYPVTYSVSGFSLGGVSPTVLDPYYADATAANRRVVRKLTQYIADDLDSIVDSSMDGSDVADMVTISEVRVVVKTWNKP